jgi:hypothetical protein
VRFKSIYERAALEEPEIKPHLARWIASGEEVRVYNGELPHKLAIFDCQVVLMPLIRPGEQTKTVLIRHPQLAQTLSLAFEHLWERSEPVAASSKTSAKQGTPDHASERVSRNGRRGQLTKKRARKI